MLEYTVANIKDHTGFQVFIVGGSHVIDIWAVITQKTVI
jgi:hypothetical protein